MPYLNTLNISDITKCVKRNKQNIKINLKIEPEFEQSEIFKTNNVKKEIVKETDNNQINNTKLDNNSIFYNENSVINNSNTEGIGFGGLGN